MQTDSQRLQTAADQHEQMVASPYELLNQGADSLEDGKVTSFYFSRFKVYDQAFSVFNLLGTGLTVLVYELVHYDLEPDIRLILLWMIFVSSVINIFLGFVRMQAKMNWKNKKGHVTDEFYFEKVEFTLEIVILMCCPMPWFENYKIYFFNSMVDAECFYYLNEIFCLLVSLRIVFYIRTTILNSTWHSNRTHRVCSLYACEASYMFTIKSMIKYYPFTSNYTAMIILIVVFGYDLRICESPLARITSSYDFSSYFNSMWAVIVTSTTLGYGDYYPRTDLGRFVMTLVCLIGNFVVSSMIVIITNESILSPLENKVVILIDRLTLKKKMRSIAAQIITTFARMYYAKKYLDITATDQNDMFKQMKQLSIQLKLTTRQYIAAQSLGSYSEELSSGFNTLKENYKQILQIQNELIANNEQQIKRLEIK